MIFAAGLGTRLLPLTNKIPKALVPVNGIPMLELVIKRIAEYGIKDFVINVHHLASQIADFLRTNNNFGFNISISDEREMLLDTGGGLLKAEPFFTADEPILIYNVDVYSDINLNELLDFHKTTDALATLAVRKRKTSRYFLFDNQGILSGWKNTITDEEIITRGTDSELIELAFSGIHVVQSDIFNYFNQIGKFSISKAYLELSKSHLINAYRHDEGIWFDLGSVENIRKLEEIIK